MLVPASSVSSVVNISVLPMSVKSVDTVVVSTLVSILCFTTASSLLGVILIIPFIPPASGTT